MVGVVVDKLLFRFSICGSVPEIFAVKVESCQKSFKILDDFFGPPKFLGAGLPKIVLSLSLLRRGTSTEKKFREDTPSSPEIIEPNTLNFRPNLKFSRLHFWGTPSPLKFALARLGQSLARVKI